jgi:hypothetical protein
LRFASDSSWALRFGVSSWAGAVPEVISSTSSFFGVTGGVLAGTEAFGGDAGSGFAVFACIAGAGFSSGAGAVVTGAGFDCCTADGFCMSVACLEGCGVGAVLNGVLKSSHPSVSKE